MADDIVTRLREYEAITDNAYVINALVTAADEIERLRTLCDQLAWALRIQCEFHRAPVATTAWYSQHANDALAEYEARRG